LTVVPGEDRDGPLFAEEFFRMARKRTLNYREFRGDYDESEEGRRKREEGESEEEEEVEDDEEEADEEEAGEEEGEEDEDEEEGEEDEDGEPKPKKKAKPVKEKPAKKPAAKPTRAKKPRGAKVVRMRVVWGVYNNSNQCIATYDFNKKQDAEEHAARMQTEAKKGTHFIQPVKQPLEEKT
jgi:hypothetical protein